MASICEPGGGAGVGTPGVGCAAGGVAAPSVLELAGGGVGSDGGRLGGAATWLPAGT
jgi:hypothetical protein